MQLNDISDQFVEAGVNIAAITYDSVDTLKGVEAERGITFDMLHDEDVTIVNTFGILNEDHEPGSFAYGIPHPGIFIIDANGVIQAKFAEEDYRERPDLADVLAAVGAL